MVLNTHRVLSNVRFAVVVCMQSGNTTENHIKGDELIRRSFSVRLNKFYSMCASLCKCCAYIGMRMCEGTYIQYEHMYVRIGGNYIEYDHTYSRRQNICKDKYKVLFRFVSVFFS